MEFSLCFQVLCPVYAFEWERSSTFHFLSVCLLCYIAARPNDSSVLICFYSQEAYVSEISPPICWSAHHILSDIFLTRLAFVNLQAISWKFLLTLVSSYEKKKLDSTRLAVCNCFVRSTYVVLFLLLFTFVSKLPGCRQDGEPSWHIHPDVPSLGTPFQLLIGVMK